MEKQILLLGVLLTLGCGVEPLDIQRYPQANTTKPSALQIEKCRKWMHIQTDTEITANGLQIETGKDTCAAFKFVAHTTDPKKLFDPIIVDASKFSQRETYYGLNIPMFSQSWWDFSKHVLNGGNFEIPNAEWLNIGYKSNDDDTLTVYVTWGET